MVVQLCVELVQRFKPNCELTSPSNKEQAAIATRCMVVGDLRALEFMFVSYPVSKKGLSIWLLPCPPQAFGNRSANTEVATAAASDMKLDGQKDGALKARCKKTGEADAWDP